VERRRTIVRRSCRFPSRHSHHCASAPAVPSVGPRGFAMNRYKILKVIGDGTYGSVLKGKKQLSTRTAPLVARFCLPLHCSHYPLTVAVPLCAVVAPLQPSARQAKSSVTQQQTSASAQHGIRSCACRPPFHFRSPPHWRTNWLTGLRCPLCSLRLLSLLCPLLTAGCDQEDEAEIPSVARMYRPSRVFISSPVTSSEHRPSLCAAP
jgi:hypothetical protein